METGAGMDFTANDARSSKRARLTPSPSASDDAKADLISGLHDDVLLRVLGLVADARDLVRTGALSRRWRCLWTRVPALRFISRPVPRAASGDEQCAALERYVCFVNDVLARRSSESNECAVESLAISCAQDSAQDLRPARAASQSWIRYASHHVHAAQGWIHYAVQHGVKSFILDLPSLSRSTVVLNLDELPSPVRIETMRLALGRNMLRLPTTIQFTSLTDLSLERISFVAAGSAHLLGRLVSSVSCPRLQKLRMVNFSLYDFNEEVRIESDVLSELWVKLVDVMALELRTPRLRVLHIDDCTHEVFRVSAPRLEELTLLYQLGCTPRLVKANGDFPCVRSLKIRLLSHYTLDYLSEGEALNDASNHILKLCSSVASIDVNLDGQKQESKDVEILKSRVLHLPRVTSLTVNASIIPMKWHDFGASVAIFLTRFINLRRLSLHLSLSMYYKGGEQLYLGCDHRDHCISNEISMSYLQELELTGLIGADCELWFIKDLFASARGIRKVAINFNPAQYLQYQIEMQMDAFERMLLDKGMCVSHRSALKLVCQK